MYTRATQDARPRTGYRAPLFASIILRAGTRAPNTDRRARQGSNSSQELMGRLHLALCEQGEMGMRGCLAQIQGNQKKEKGVFGSTLSQLCDTKFLLPLPTSLRGLPPSTSTKLREPKAEKLKVDSMKEDSDP
ncbi:hypothetical protein BHE74_00046140 [Ensete ventricosum]|nr:hypothetical protein BHE74_00046140 [Ensete ventricosum]